MPAALHLERETSVRPSSGFGAVGRTETTSGVKLGRATVRGRPPLIVPSSNPLERDKPPASHPKHVWPSRERTGVGVWSGRRLCRAT